MPQMGARRIESRRVEIRGDGPAAGLRMFHRVLDPAHAEEGPPMAGAGTPPPHGSAANAKGGAYDARGDAVPRRSADTVILVHGLGVSGAYWTPTARRLAERFRVLVPDLPGFGDSDKPRRVLDVGELAGALAAWMDAMEIDRAPLVANSLGCQVSVRMALERPERVTRLILQGMTIDPEARSAPVQIMRLLADAFVEPPSILPLVVRDYLKCGPRRLIGTLRHILDDPIAEHLKRIDVPALVVRGDLDPIVPQRWAEESARLLPHGRLIVIPDAAHALNFARPKGFARVIIDYLERGEVSACYTSRSRSEPGWVNSTTPKAAAKRT